MNIIVENSSVRLARSRERHSDLLRQHRALFLAQPAGPLSPAIRLRLDDLWRKIQTEYSNLQRELS